MIVVMTLLVRDEEDIVDSNLQHHLDEGVDFFIATDNRSADGTRAILERYRDRGVLRLIDEPGRDYSQDRWVTRMARMAHDDLAATWVLHADADEFFVARGSTVSAALEGVGQEFGLVRVPRRNFRPRPQDGRPFHQRMTVRDVRALNPLGRPLPPKVCHRGHPEVVVAVGNHDVTKPALAPCPDEPLEILHYPIRSYSQLARSVRLGAEAVARNPRFGPEIGGHWRWMSELLRAGRLRDYYDSQVVDADELAEGLRRGELVVDTRLADRLGNGVEV